MQDKQVVNCSIEGVRQYLMTNPKVRYEQDLSVVGQSMGSLRLNQVCMTILNEKKLEFSENFGLKGMNEIIFHGELSRLTDEKTEIRIKLASRRLFRDLSRIVFAVLCLLMIFWFFSAPPYQDNRYFVLVGIVIALSAVYQAIDYFNIRIFLVKLKKVLAEIGTES